MMMNKNELYSSLDDGPTQCSLTLLHEQLQEKYGNFNSSLNNEEEFSNFYLREFLGFVRDEKFTLKIEEFSNLLERVLNNDNLMKEFKFPNKYIIEWIHFCNRIEFLGPDNLEETELYIKQLHENVETESINLENFQSVKNLFNLFENSFNIENFQNNLISSVIFDENSLKKWFGILMPNEKHEFREYGCETSICSNSDFDQKSNEFNSSHKYPHHSIVKPSIKLLCKDVYNICNAITICNNFEEQIGYIFGLAAFSQFHFVDIHPFIDGNGRLCRLISKRILDWLLPFPFPMFKNRNYYFYTLLEGRREENVKNAPKLLMELLLDSSIEYYKEILSQEFKIHLLSVVNSNEFDQMVENGNLTQMECELLKREFNNLQINENITIKINEMKAFKLTRIEEIDFDSI